MAPLAAVEASPSIPRRPQPIEALILQFCVWVRARVPTHAEVLDTWQSTCPRLSVWEDTLLGGLVTFDGTTDRRVILTLAGYAALDAEGGAPSSRTGNSRNSRH